MKAPVKDRVAAALAALALALPVVLFAYPPMTDLPHHEALVALLRHHGDASMFPAIYVKNLGQPNQLFHFLAWPLSYVVDVTTACKLITALAVAGVPLGAARFARGVSSPGVAALAVTPLAVGWLFSWGFVNNLLGLGILLAAIPEIDRLAQRPALGATVRVSLAVLLLYFAHELMMFVAVGAVGLFALLTARSLGGFAVRAAPAGFGLAAALWQIGAQEGLKTTTVRSIPNIWLPISQKFREIPAVLVGGVELPERTALFALLLGFFIALFVVGRRHARRGAAARDAAAAPVASLRERLSERRVELLAIAVFGLYLVGPFAFNGAMLVHERFLAPAFAIGAVAVARHVDLGGPLGRSGESALIRVFGAILPLAALSVQLPHYFDAARNYHDMERLFERITPNSSVAAVDLDKNQGGRPFTVASGLSRVLVRRGGRVLYSFSESTVAPVILAPRFQWNEPSARIMLDNTKFRPKHDFTRFRYLLLHSSNPGRIATVRAAVGEEASFVAVTGEWALFESRLPVVPLDAPDVPLPTPRPETLARRLFFIERGIQRPEDIGVTP